MSAATECSLAVIIRTLGHPRLGEALASLAAQTRTDFEVAVVDMTPGTVAPILSAHRAHLPRLTHLRIGRPRRRPVALNLGIQATAAPAIGILDEDNLYGPEQVDTLVAGLAATGADLVYTPVRRQTLTADGELLQEVELGGGFDPANLLFGNFIFATGTAFRRTIWAGVGGYDARFPVFEDWDFLIRVAHAGRVVPLDVHGRPAGISRSFTGDPAVSSHNLEAAACDRARAGLFWTHRRRYTRELFASHPEYAARHPDVPVGGRGPGAGPLLLRWWWRDVLGRYWS